jgi:hypothetical protein
MEIEMKYRNNLKLTSAAALGLWILLASGCGGGGGSTETSSSGNSVVSRGLITGFGSVYVNGRKFRTNGTTFSIDDDDSLDESALKVGMIVTVTGSKDDDGVDGHATHISYDNELKGPVTSIVYDTPDPADATMATLVMLGQTVTASLDTTIDDDGGLTFDSLRVGNVLEVSGYVTDTGLLATHIELQDDDTEIEIKGYIDNGSLTTDSFTIKGFPISYNDTTQLDDITELAEGLFVEVEGGLIAGGTILFAREIEREHEGLDEGMDEAEIQGEIYDYDDVEMTFKILEQLIYATGAELYPSRLVLADGVIVEAEGRMVDGILFADEIEQKGKKIKIAAILSDVNSDSDGNGSISFRFNLTDVIVVRVDARQTELEDDIGGGEIMLSDLSQGDFVEMEAFDDGTGVINAVEIERKPPGEEVRIVAPVENWGDEFDRSVMLLGVEFDLAAASYENELDQPIPAGTFYNSLSLGEFIKIKDRDSNGDFDRAELED